MTITSPPVHRPDPPGGRPSAPAEARARLLRAVRTVPGGLRLSGLVLAVLVLAFGAVTGWQVDGRAQAADRIVERSQPLSQDAAEIYRSLADADTTAATGFLLAGSEPKAVRERYEQDLTRASSLLTRAAARTTASSGSQRWLTALNEQLPVYAGLVETARAYNREGVPLGGAYLRFASTLMQQQDQLHPDDPDKAHGMLAAAQQLYEAENRQLQRDYADARAVPYASLALGVLALVALVRFQRQLFRRTNRVFNVGLLGATAATATALLWLLVGHGLARSDLADSDRGGAAPLRMLDQARIQALQGRGAENLNLVARGSTTEYADRWESVTKQLAGDRADGSGGTLGDALALAAGDAEGRARVQAAVAAFRSWDRLHDTATADNDKGDYPAAVAATVGSGATTDAAFERMDRELSAAVDHEQRDFRAAADDGRDALGGLAVGAGVLALLAAAAALLGIGRRLAEYR
ncbi:hypothetical protein [Peterkaempfera bronchialis]|uniref:Secreted protein n=1 Tax=Peterkaempfera bronchialis TaxID=2126346 RepID=A0A345SV49_9ACTN|nr:hypothetical protein [Peterkaempfera bronchialis]AXI77604.1 hypothetical protein C7M71_009275 [Peterkaempfera bronchialis]